MSTPTQTIKYTSSLITCTIQYAYYVPLGKDPTNLLTENGPLPEEDSWGGRKLSLIL